MIWFFKSARTPSELLSALEDPDAEIRGKAYTELIEHEDPNTDQEVLFALKGLHEGAKELLIPLIDITGKRGIEDAIEVLGNHFKDDDPEVKMAVLRALIHIPTQQSLDLILPLLADEDLAVRREVREAVVKVFEDRAMGAMMRAISDNHNTPLYFEIVSLFEEMGFFEKLKEDAQHPDYEVKKYQLNNMIKFHRPDFIPFYLEMYEVSPEGVVGEKIKNALKDYSPDELIPHIRNAFQTAPNKPIVKLIDEIVISRFPEVKEQFLQMGEAILRPDIRLDFFERILKKLDAYMFVPAFALIDDSALQIRNLVCEALLRLIQNVKNRLADPQEQNKAFLRKELDHWTAQVHEKIKRETSADYLSPLIKLFLSMAQDKPELVVPVLPKLLSEQFTLTINHLNTWDNDVVEEVLTQTIKHDKAVGTTLVQGFNTNPTPELVKIILKNFHALERNDVLVFRKAFASRALTGKIPNFFDDPDPKIRLASLELLADSGTDILAGRVEEKCHDPSPEVRLKALQIARTTRHPKISQLLEEACADPAAVVALQSLKDLKKMVPEDRYSKILARSIVSPIEEIKVYALQEIAKITQKRYIANFNTLPPKVKKLAGSAILKLDASFVDHLIVELKSLDPDSRLRAALILENLQVGGKAKDALLEGMKDPSKKVRAAIVKTLGVLGDKGLLSNLIEFFNDPDERVRANAIEAVSGIGDDRAVKLLLPFLDDSNNRIRANAALAVWQIGKVNIIPFLNKMLSSGDTLMKASGLWVFGEMKSELYLSMILTHVKDKAEIVRLNALKAIAKIKPDVLKPFLPQLRQDSSAEVKKLVAELSFKII